MEQNFTISFENATRFDLDNGADFPERSGIYLIRETKDTKEGGWNPTLVYIGKADNLNNRLNSPEHEGIEAAKKACKNNGSFITIAYAFYEGDFLGRIEACLIFVNKPKYNTLNKDSFDYDKTTVNVKGERKTGLKEENIAVRSK